MTLETGNEDIISYARRLPPSALLLPSEYNDPYELFLQPSRPLPKRQRAQLSEA
jgi:hypothetical protein